ncbi:MAG: bifunctional helix-turn-helix transcriptional regulator/GNAT family N-acetyltransferase [Myxococcales bacterium]|nr:bifunctional helix-turn-helix transcriptional regulator/GNAT family N-acetyltransferase [Myxococcales bacterium]MCB9644331.1 bifunctional helix-turn-helix transcriptional regulator/GNAT family N-acetyltransferase [Myxococcales bacterium]
MDEREGRWSLGEEEDFIAELGPLALANRLKRLSDVMITSGRKMYKSLGMDIEPSWYLIFLLLKRDGALGITEIAQKLRYAHPSVVTLVSKMLKKRYLEAHKDEQDGRKQLVSLSDKAKAALPAFERLWAAGAKGIEDVFDQGDAARFMAYLGQLDQRFQRKDFHQRTVEALKAEEDAQTSLPRLAKKSDEDAIWEIFSQVISTGETYAFSPRTPKTALSALWLAASMRTYVYEREGKIAGTYILKPNQPDAGGHIANAAYMVHPAFQGQGIGRMLCEHSLQEARSCGYRAMQFNLVVSTNLAAVALWQRCGFRIIGTTPDGFQHPTLGLVDTYIMHRKL